MNAGTAVRLDSVDQAITDIAAGRPVIVMTDENGEGYLVVAGSFVTPELAAFASRHSDGKIGVAMPEEILDRLTFDLISDHTTETVSTAPFHESDTTTAVTSMSDVDAATTVRMLANTFSFQADPARRGGVFPMRTREGGVLAHRRPAEAAVDLACLGGATPVGVVVPLVNDDDTVTRNEQLRGFADGHGLTMISIDSLVAHRYRREILVKNVAHTRLPTIHGDFIAHGYRTRFVGTEHVALAHGDLRGEAPVLTRIHSECLTGDAFGSSRCDCGPQLDQALERISAHGRGVVVYLRGHEGRGIGLAAKLRAYELQDGGMDTVDANYEQGLPADARHYGEAAQILEDLGVNSVDLLTNNPDKSRALEEFGIHVAHQVPVPVNPNPHNLAYLMTKRDRMGHDLPGLGELQTITGGH